MTQNSPHAGGRTGGVITRRKWLRRLILVAPLGLVLGGVLVFWGRGEPRAATEIRELLMVGTGWKQPMKAVACSIGRAWTSPPRALSYMSPLSPLDPSAVARGWEYRLRRIKDVVNSEHLAVAINATLFTSNSGWWPLMSGDLANSVETVVADHVVNHIWEHTYLLWFDDKLTPHLPPSKPPSAADLAAAWGIGGQGVGLRDGKVGPGNDRNPDSRTAVGIDPSHKLLFLAVGQNISPRLMLAKLADLGAKDGMLLDGGGSSAMAIGKGAAGISAGAVYGGWRPVATYFGVKASPLQVGKS